MPSPTKSPTFALPLSNGKFSQPGAVPLSKDVASGPPTVGEWVIYDDGQHHCLLGKVTSSDSSGCSINSDGVVIHFSKEVFAHLTPAPYRLGETLIHNIYGTEGVVVEMDAFTSVVEFQSKFIEGKKVRLRVSHDRQPYQNLRRIP